jgi:predicted metal-binding protein
MVKRRRKTLVVCTTCHDAIHAENLTATLTA